MDLYKPIIEKTIETLAEKPEINFWEILSGIMLSVI